MFMGNSDVNLSVYSKLHSLNSPFPGATRGQWASRSDRCPPAPPAPSRRLRRPRANALTARAHVLTAPGPAHPVPGSRTAATKTIWSAALLEKSRTPGCPPGPLRRHRRGRLRRACSGSIWTRANQVSGFCPRAESTWPGSHKITRRRRMVCEPLGSME